MSVSSPARRWLLFGLAIVLLTSVVASVMVVTGNVPWRQAVNASAASPAPYNFPFTMGMPTSPQPWRPSTWDVAVHQRDDSTNGLEFPFAADHGSDCGPPPATHTVSNTDDSVFICHDHIMTAQYAESYGVTYLQPDHMADWSGGNTLNLTFPVSTWRTSERDWIDLWITPFNEQLELPWQFANPDLQGPPRDAVHIYMDHFNNGTVFKAEVYRNFQATDVSTNTWTYLENVVPPSKTVRTPFELDLSSGHIRFGIPSANFWWVDSAINPGLTFTQGVVQMGHHSYNPKKADGCGPTMEQISIGAGCEPDTWHWGGLSMSSAVPYTLIRANQRYASAAAGTHVTFPSPAPANSFLRFNGYALPKLSLDGGKTWQTPPTQAESAHGDSHVENYWVPIPAGTQSVDFSGSDTYVGPWQVRDLTIMSADASSQSASGATATPTTPAAPSPTAAPSSPSPTPAPQPVTINGVPCMVTLPGSTQMQNGTCTGTFTP